MFVRYALRCQRVSRQYSVPNVAEYIKRIEECNYGEGGTNAFVSIDFTSTSGVLAFGERGLMTSAQED